MLTPHTAQEVGQIMAHLIVGSEGTLGFVAEATLRTVPVHPLVTTTVAVFPTLVDATRSLPDFVASEAATLELMDAASIRVGQNLDGVPDAIAGFETASGKTYQHILELLEEVTR